MFAQELRDLCGNGLQIFAKRDQRCGFNMKGGGCVNRRLAHNEHCDERGNRESGPFDESQQCSPDTLNNIYTRFIKYYERLCTDELGETFSLPNPKKSSQFRETVLREYTTVWETTRSNKTCLACLQSVPDHVL